MAPDGIGHPGGRGGVYNKKQVPELLDELPRRCSMPIAHHTRTHGNHSSPMHYNQSVR